MGRTFYLFNINSSIMQLTKDDAYPLFYSFSKIKNMNKSDLSTGINLFEQLTELVDKNKFNKNIYNHYKESDFYSKFKNDHTYINKYRDEKSYLNVKNSFIKITSNRDNPEFFKYLKRKNNLFVCDFDNKDYFWMKDI